MRVYIICECILHHTNYRLHPHDIYIGKHTHTHTYTYTETETETQTETEIETEIETETETQTETQTHALDPTNDRTPEHQSCIISRTTRVCP